MTSRGCVGFEIDDLFPLVDALSILGLANVESGDLVLSLTN